MTNEQKCAHWYERAWAGQYIMYEAHACGRPPEEHYALRNTVAPPRGVEWSSDREYYPDHEFVAGATQGGSEQ